jgi:hypothetical protein
MDNFRVRASTSTRVSNIDIMTLEGLSDAYQIGASECLVAGKKLDDGFSDLTGEYIVTFHAIELGLKAFLIRRGLTEDELKKKPYGHNLVGLYKKAVGMGLVLHSENADDLISWINEWHNDGVKIRYDFSSQRTLPMCVLLFPLAEEIINSVPISS